MHLFKKIQEMYKTFISRKGLIEFAAGNYETFVYARIKSNEKVYFNIEEDNHETSNNTFVIKQKKGGFKVFAKVKSNMVKFFWYIK